MKSIILTSVLLLFFTNSSFSQMSKDLMNDVDNKQLKLKESSFVIKGTSTLHDWVSNIEKSSAFIILNDEETQIEKLNLVVEVASIRNTKGSSMMDKLTRKALKEKQFPNIEYEFINATIIENQSEVLKLKLFGELTIAGKTNKVTIITGINKTGDKVTLKGSHTMKMTDYNVAPPTALFGTVKTGDEITIDFSIEF